MLDALILLAGTPALADVSPFRTPSGNIECAVGTGEAPSDVTCAIHDFSGVPNVPRPSSCRAPWGHLYQMTETGRVEMLCGGPGPKNTAPGVDVAGYGQTATWGRLWCTSERTGLTCQNGDGHGFLLSRRVLKVW